MRKPPRTRAHSVGLAARVGAPDHRVGDKIRVKGGAHAGLRAIVARTRQEGIVAISVGGETFVLPPNTFTNFSLAARRAWAVMPKRAGRPAANKPRRKMVSLRLELELLERLDRAVAAGLVRNRSEAVSTSLDRELRRLGIAAHEGQMSPPRKKSPLVHSRHGRRKKEQA